MGGASLFAPLFPLRIGVIEWEFGTASEFFDNVPIFGLGLEFLMAAGLAAGAKGRVRSLALVCIFLALLMWLTAGLYATVVPQAYNAAPSPTALTAIKKAVGKTAVQILIYPVGFLSLGILGVALRPSAAIDDGTASRRKLLWQNHNSPQF